MRYPVTRPALPPADNIAAVECSHGLLPQPRVGGAAQGAGPPARPHDALWAVHGRGGRGPPPQSLDATLFSTNELVLDLTENRCSILQAAAEDLQITLPTVVDKPYLQRSCFGSLRLAEPTRRRGGWLALRR